MDSLSAWRKNRKFLFKVIAFSMSFCRRYILVTICTSWASELDFEDESEKVDRFFDLPLLVRVEDPSEYSVRDLFMWAP